MSVHFKLVKLVKEDEKNYAVSKIGGQPVFPKDFMKKHHLEDDLFICQVNLKELHDEKLPEKGFLYFFLNTRDYPYKPKVFFSEDEDPIEVVEDINDAFDFSDDRSGFQMVRTDEDTGFGLDTPFDPNIDADASFDTEGKVNLLELDTISLPEGVLQLGQPDGWYMFIIKETDLAKRDFSKVEFNAFGS